MREPNSDIEIDAGERPTGRAMAFIAASVVVLGMVFVPTSIAAAADGEVDGCTAVPDSGPTFDFNDACDDHDRCYIDRPYGDDSTARRSCDRIFYADTKAWCNDRWSSRSDFFERGACKGVAWVYYVGVRAFGRSAWESGLTAPLAG